MSYEEFIRGSLDASGSQPRTRAKKTAPKTRTREGLELDGKLDQSERVVAALQDELGPAKTAYFLAYLARRYRGTTHNREMVDLTSDSDEEDVRTTAVPYGFWPRYMRSVNLLFTYRKKMQLSRSLIQYAQRQHSGCRTRVGFRGMRKGKSLRCSGGAENATKGVGLSFMLLQYFVDFVQRLKCRTDSTLLMQKARELRGVLLNDESGRWRDEHLPKLVGNAGVQWFRRWRKRYGISKQVTGMKLKVAWRKIKNRVFRLLQNIFRLRRFWEICHEGKPMRWLSVDQTPSWWNNAGLTGTFAKKGGKAPSVTENFAHTRQRYTILTVVPYGWSMIDHPDDVPKVAMLFKGKPNGKIKKNWIATVVKRIG